MRFLNYILLFAFLVEQNFIFSIEASASPEQVEAISSLLCLYQLQQINPSKRVIRKPARLQDYEEYSEESDDDSLEYAPSFGSKVDPIRRTRTGKFICDECDSTFTRSSNLRRHQRIHTGVMAYKCPECGKKFRERHHLAAHLRMEYGEKNYHCSKCGYLFVDKSNCVRHELICKN